QHAPDVARVVGAEEQRPAALCPEPAPPTEGDPGGGDRWRVPELRQDRARPVLVGVPWRASRAGLVRAPAVVPALRDQVELVVALGPVLRLPQAAGLRVEREPE